MIMKNILKQNEKEPKWNKQRWKHFETTIKSSNYSQSTIKHNILRFSWECHWNSVSGIL